MKLTVLGAGAWGTALAASAAVRHPTCLWARDPAHLARIESTRVNASHLPGVALPAALQVVADFDTALAHAAGGLVIVATPMAALEEMLRRIGPRTGGVLWLCKGFDQRTGWLGHEIAHRLGNEDDSDTRFGTRSGPSFGPSFGARFGVLSGPSFAIEVARGQPTALVAASADASLCDDAVAALHSDNLRIYTSDDPIGVEVGGAVKNVLAIATGIADGMPSREGCSNGLGLNARAALITRGLAEMTRLGVALGARAETFMGLSGLGDLVLTATGDLSRNRTVGCLLAGGSPLARILAELGHVAEGVSTAPMLQRRAEAVGVDMPIVQAVVGVLEGRVTPAQALERLMGRGARAES